MKNIEKTKGIKRLPLSSDIVLKRVFSKEENKELLKSILEAILKIRIESIEIKNPEIPRDLTSSKAGTLDIKVEINKDTVIDVEMQVEDENNFDDRSTRYLISMSNDELKKGEDYTKTRKTITISLLNFNYLKRNSFLNVAHMKFESNTEKTYVDMGYKKEDELATDKLEMITIELPKFKKKNPKTDNELNQWLWLIIGEEEKIKMASKENGKIKKAIKIIDEMSMDSKEWELYRARQMAIMNYNIGMKNSEKKGEKIGEKIGEKKTREKIVKNLLNIGLDAEKIIEATGITKEELNRIEREHKK